MGASLERAWEVCRMLDEADAERCEREVARACALSNGPREPRTTRRTPARTTRTPIPAEKPAKAQPRTVVAQDTPKDKPTPSERLSDEDIQRIRARQRRRLGLGA